MHSLIFTAAIVLAATPVLADPTPATPKPAKGSPEEVICHREAPTGSLIAARRVCKTRAEWQAQADANQRAAQDGEDHSRINSQAPQ